LQISEVLASLLHVYTLIGSWKQSIPLRSVEDFQFDKGVGQTFFDITKLHGLDDAEGSIIEVDYYNAASLLVMDDESILAKAKKDLDTMLGDQCINVDVLDAASVRLPSAMKSVFTRLIRKYAGCEVHVYLQCIFRWRPSEDRTMDLGHRKRYL